MSADRPVTTDRSLVAAVLAGGIGSRLYPASRSHRPKQLLALGNGDETLLERTVSRVAFADEVVVVTRPEFADAVRETVPEASVLVEPAGKDTGPALAYATHWIDERIDDPTVLALPSDHHVAGDFETAACRGARVAAETAALVTFGVDPTRPDTGYGYIEPGRDHGDYAEVDAFHEKPGAETATAYVDRGYYWNAGIFAWTPTALLDAARDTPLAPLVDALDDGDPARGFAAVDPISVDYAVLERTDDLAVVPATFDWDDLGSWDAVARHLRTDAQDNAVLGNALTIDARDNVIASDGHVSLVGVDDLVVASFGDRTVVVPKDDAQRVREVVAELKTDDLF